jgi:SDR family mycofactocin-dependent oxidoreductase
MAGRVAGKVAFITGAGHGQGRSHAIRLAEEGADIIAIDIAQPDAYPILGYATSTEEELADTVKQVEALDRRIIARQADVRDLAALKRVVDEGVAELGKLDIAIANAGICTIQTWDEVTPRIWQDTLDTNLTGVWNTMVAATPHLIANGGGSIICTSSTAGIKGLANSVHYNAAKHGVVGIMRSIGNEFAQYGIRVNSVHPTGVNTIMIQNKEVWGLFDPANPNPTRESAESAFKSLNVLDIPWVEPVDISNAILFLASDEARYITGVTLPVDAGAMIK